MLLLLPYATTFYDCPRRERGGRWWSSVGTKEARNERQKSRSKALEAVFHGRRFSLQLRSPDVAGGGGGGGIPRQSTGVTGQVTGYFRAFHSVQETRADLALIKPFDYRSRYTGGRQPSKRTERFINNLPRLTSGEKKNSSHQSVYPMLASSPA